MDLSKQKKYLTADVVFMAVFAVSLLVARFMVVNKHKIVLSEPVKLESASLSVRMPTGNGWRFTDKWVKLNIEGCYGLAAGMRTGHGNDILVQWRYISKAEPAEPQSRLAKRAGELNSEIIEAGQLTGQSQMEWAQLQPSGGGSGDIFIGCGKLGYGQVLELEVVVLGSPSFARRIFEKVGESVISEKGMYYE
jgi:hypothetical protein